MAYEIVPNSITYYGYVYPSWYKTSFNIGEASQGIRYLGRLKGVRHLLVVIDRENKKRFVVSDVNQLTQQAQDIVGKFINDVDVNVTLFLQHQDNCLSAKEMFTYVENIEDEYWVFKESLQGVGYSYQVCVWNNSTGTFALSGMDVEQNLKGKRYISGTT